MKVVVNIDMTEQELRQVTSEARALLEAMKEVKGLIMTSKYEAKRAARETHANKDRAE